MVKIPLVVAKKAERWLRPITYDVCLSDTSHSVSVVMKNQTNNNIIIDSTSRDGPGTPIHEILYITKAKYLRPGIF